HVYSYLGLISAIDSTVLSYIFLFMHFFCGISFCFFFFFKQKTAYEIGLGIPAEPLFRSLKQMLRDFIGIRVNRAKKSGMVNITSSVNSRERSGINTILHELNPLFTINVTMRDIKSKNVY